MADAGTVQNGPPPGRDRGHGPEFLVLGLLALVALLVCFQNAIFGRNLIISPATQARFTYHSYNDDLNNGNSVFEPTSSPLRWACDLRTRFAFPYCGYEIVLDRDGAAPGFDLRDLETIEITLDYRGPPTTVRVSLKNEDPRYSRHGDRITAKTNASEFSLKPGRQTMVLRPRDFSVPGWWLSQRKLPPELSRTQFDHVVALEFMTGSNATAGHYSFVVESVRIHRMTVSAATLYLTILIGLVGAVAIYVLARIRRVRLERERQARADAETRTVLAEAKLAAERANKAKSDFLASMSHELRTPLNAVLGYAQLLERDSLTDKQRRAVCVIHRSGDHLLNLISDILDLSKIEAGKMELHPEPCDLHGSLAAVADMVRIRAEEQGIAFAFHIGEEVPKAVVVDEKRLRQVLLNLLGNAVKFTEQGGVSLNVSLLRRQEGLVCLRFEVIDSGPGIASDELDRIFAPFEQVGDVGRRQAGTGLGLAISRQLASMMGSDIQVESRLGEGSRFWFDGEFAVASRAMIDVPALQPDVSNELPPLGRVLIADDVADNRNLLCDFLSGLGFECFEAETGDEALQLAREAYVDLVLMDLEMPGSDGCETTRSMRADEALGRLPIVIVSANLSDDARAAAMAAGASGFVGKPLCYDVLLQSIGRAFSCPVPQSQLEEAHACS